MHLKADVSRSFSEKSGNQVLTVSGEILPLGLSPLLPEGSSLVFRPVYAGLKNGEVGFLFEIEAVPPQEKLSLSAPVEVPPTEKGETAEVE